MNEYFTHDYNARNDLSVKKLFMSEGLAGIGLYWCLVEMLYEKNGYIDINCIPTIAFDLRTTEEKINEIIDKYNLFSRNKTKFFSKSVLKRLNVRNEKSEKARKSAEKRWVKSHNESNANEMRTHNESNAIKEKEIKEKEIKLNNISKQASNLKKEDNNSACACEGSFKNEDYNDLLDGFGVYGEYRDAIFRFIAHLKVNFNKVMLNDRLENLIIVLDRYEEEHDRIRLIDDAILKGYQRLECEGVG